MPNASKYRLLLWYIPVYTLVMFVFKVVEALDRARVQYAIAGGWAVALHGAVRGTVDLDLVVALTKANMEKIEKALGSVGLESRLPLRAQDVVEFREEYIQNRKMLAWRFVNPMDPTEIVDILIIDDLRHLKTKSIKVGNRGLPVVAVEDLIRMKRASGRPQDLEDILALEALHK